MRLLDDGVHGAASHEDAAARLEDGPGIFVERELRVTAAEIGEREFFERNADTLERSCGGESV